MKRFGLLLILTIVVLMMCGCDKVNEPEEKPALKELIPVSSIKGVLRLPAGSPLSYSDLSAISPSGKSPIAASGEFTIAAPSQSYCPMYVVNTQGQQVAAYYGPTNIDIEISATSTCIAIIAIFPMNWGEMGITPSDLISLVQSDSHFNDYRSLIENLMINQPYALMDPTANSEAIGLAVIIINDIVRSVATRSGSMQYKTPLAPGDPYIVDIPQDPNIRIVNPKAIPYGISTYYVAKDPHQISSYGILSLPIYVNGWDISLWYDKKDGEALYKVSEGGDCRVVLSKPDINMLLQSFNIFGAINLAILQQYEFQDALAEGDYLRILKHDAALKSQIGTMLTLAVRALNIASVVDPVEATGLMGLVIKNAPTKGVQLFSKIVLGGAGWTGPVANLTIKEAVRAVMQNVSINIEVIWIAIEGWALEDGYALRMSAEFAKLQIENVTILLDWIDALENLGQIFCMGYDLAFGPQDLEFLLSSKWWGGFAPYPQGQGLSGPVRTLLTANGQLYAGGFYSKAGNVDTKNSIASWNGSQWSAVGSNALHWEASWPPTIQELAIYNNSLVAGGSFFAHRDFMSRDCKSMACIAFLSNNTWQPFDKGLMNQVEEITVFDGHLVAGGHFEYTDGFYYCPSDTVLHLAYWDRQSWKPIGNGIKDTEVDGTVTALCIFNGDLIVSGRFHEIDGISFNHIARWDGSTWHALDGGLNDDAFDMTVYRGKLVAVGNFTFAGGELVNFVAQWDGNTWSPLGQGLLDQARAVMAYNDKLYVVGFCCDDTNPAGYAYCWDGENWSNLCPGGINGAVNCIAEFNSNIYIGGYFTVVDYKPSNYIARLND